MNYLYSKNTGDLHSNTAPYLSIVIDHEKSSNSIFSVSTLVKNESPNNSINNTSHGVSSSISTAGSSSYAPSSGPNNPQSNLTILSEHTSCSVYEFPECDDDQAFNNVSLENEEYNYPTSVIKKIRPQTGNTPNQSLNLTDYLSQPSLESPSSHNTHSPAIFSPEIKICKPKKLWMRDHLESEISQPVNHVKVNSKKRKRSRSQSANTNMKNLKDPPSTTGRLVLKLKREDSDNYRVAAPPEFLIHSTIKTPHVSQDSSSESSVKLPPTSTSNSTHLSSFSDINSDYDSSTFLSPSTVRQGSGTKSFSSLEFCKLSDGRVFHVGDIVWAKIQGYPFWPSRIIRIDQHEIPMTSFSKESLSHRHSGSRNGNKSRQKSNSISVAPYCVPSEREGYVLEYKCCVDWLAWNQCSYITCDKLFQFEENFHQKYSPKNKKKLYLQAVEDAKRIIAIQKDQMCSNNNLDLPTASILSNAALRHSETADNSASLFNNTQINYNLTTMKSLDSVNSSHSMMKMSFPDEISTFSSVGFCVQPEWSAGDPLLSISVNSHDLPELSGDLFDSVDCRGPPIPACDIPEFSDDEEMTVRQSITGSVNI